MDDFKPTPEELIEIRKKALAPRPMHAMPAMLPSGKPDPFASIYSDQPIKFGDMKTMPQPDEAPMEMAMPRTVQTDPATGEVWWGMDLSPELKVKMGEATVDSRVPNKPTVNTARSVAIRRMQKERKP